MMDDLVLSASSVTAWLRCHHRYLLTNVFRHKRVAQSMPAAIGQAVHSGAEAHWKGSGSPVEALRAAFAHEVASVPAPEVEADPAALPDAERLLGVYLDEVAPRYRPTMIEAPFLVRVDGILLSGTIDNADPDTTDEVHDIKTVSMISKFHPESYDLQLSMYALGYQGLTGRRPKRLVLDVLPRTGRVRYREVVREPDIGAARDVLSVVRDGIARGDYEPTGAMNGACGWCPVRNLCEFSRA